MLVLRLLALLAAVAVLFPIAVLFVECVAASLPGRPRRTPAPARAPRMAVLVPAHDEEELIEGALDSVRPDLGEGDRLLVVAHNCTDETAERARAAGAEVVEATDDGTGGKPDALKAGLRALDADPPDVVVIVDADCLAGEGAVRSLASAAAAHAGPVQATYLFRPADDPVEGDAAAREASISSLALMVKNQVRPTGLHRLGLPCLLNGSGSAYPFAVLRQAPHGEGSIAEDYQLTLDLALEGHATSFVPEARVESRLPGRRQSALAQRRRWEHGHLYLVFVTAPRLFLRALARRSATLLTLSLDLSVPPLAFLALGWFLAAALAVAALLVADDAGPALLVGFGGVLLFTAVLAAWIRFAGTRVALRAILDVPRYVLWKVPLYVGYVLRRETRWRKTERG